MGLAIGKEVVEWVAKRTGEFHCFGTDIGIGWMKDGALVAGVAYANYNGVNIEAHIASNGSKKWMTKAFLWTIFDYPFNQAKVKRITLCIGESNSDARKFAENLGFVLEARLAEAHPTGDLCIYRLFAHECRFVQVKNEQLLAA